MLIKNLLEIIPLIILYAVLYLVANKLPIFNPTQVPLTAVDGWFEFNQHWTIIYFTSYLSIPLSYCFYFYKIKSFFKKTFLMLMISTFVIYMLFPTFVPREAIPMESLNAFNHFWMVLLHSADSPTNCIPSLHVSTALIVVFFFHYAGNKPWVLYSFIYYLLVSASTLYIKQHYFLDVVTGTLSAIICYLTILWWEKRNGKNSLG